MMLHPRVHCVRYATQQLQAACENRSPCLRKLGKRPMTTSAPRVTRRRFTASVPLLVAAAVGTGSVYLISGQVSFPSAHAEAADKDDDTDPNPRGKVKEQLQDILSTRIVEKRWEDPGVYLWGANAGHVAAPDSDEKYVKTPRRYAFFDDRILRDLKLDRSFGAAIDEKGDLLQWGKGFSKDPEPVMTLRGKDLKSLAISRDRILALAGNGAVYSVPVTAAEQTPVAPGRFSFWSGSPSIACRELTPLNLGWTEKVTALAAGLDHVLLLTSAGRVFAAPTSATTPPTRGQLGLADPSTAAAADRAVELAAFRGCAVAQVAAGDYHSVARARDGRVFVFGDNTLGQLGLPYTADRPAVGLPAPLPIAPLYPAGTRATVTAIAAGGTNTYLTIDATAPDPAALASLDDPAAPAASHKPQPASAARRLPPHVLTADTWSCGSGIWGTLGTGHRTHAQDAAVRVPALSGLYAWSDARQRLEPIRLAALSVGGTHVAAVLGTARAATRGAGAAGADVLLFGNNEDYQLGTGRRSNAPTPVYIRGVDGGAAGEEGRMQVAGRRRVRVGGRWVEVEQRVECGRGVTAVYSGVPR